MTYEKLMMPSLIHFEICEFKRYPENERQQQQKILKQTKQPQRKRNDLQNNKSIEEMSYFMSFYNYRSK